MMSIANKLIDIFDSMRCQAQGAASLRQMRRGFAISILSLLSVIVYGCGSSETTVETRTVTESVEELPGAG
jgi:hypothetical protein